MGDGAGLGMRSALIARTREEGFPTGNGDAIRDKYNKGKVLWGLFFFMSENLDAGKVMYAVPAADMRPVGASERHRELPSLCEER